MAARIYTDKDGDLRWLKGKTCAVIGFGAQGRAHALNLRDSGLAVVVGLYRESKSRVAARRAGLKVVDTPEAVCRADVIFLALPDTKIPEVYKKEIARHLRPDQTLVVAHGFAIHQNPSRHAKRTALAWAKGIGSTRAGVIETTFREETETDLFGEQAVLCGGTSALIRAGFETLARAGYPPELAYFECLHELKFIVDLIHEAGIAGMRALISETAKWGELTVGPKIIDQTVQKRMATALRAIRSGKFAREFIREMKTGRRRYARLLRESEKHPIETVGRRLRSLMSWKTKTKKQ